LLFPLTKTPPPLTMLYWLQSNPAGNLSEFRAFLAFFLQFTDLLKETESSAFAMCQDYSSAGFGHGQFDKTHWSMVLEAVRRAPRKPWRS
jgi:hypothetical protein